MTFAQRFLPGRAGRLAAENGGRRPGQGIRRDEPSTWVGPIKEADEVRLEQFSAVASSFEQLSCGLTFSKLHSGW